jgi:SAM-dependent methyltransferase
VLSPRHVTGVDPSDGFVSFARHKVTDERTTFQIGDAQKLSFADGSFDATVSGLVINFILDQARAVNEMKRVTRPRGVVGAYVWDCAGEMQMMRHFWNAAVALDPNVASLDEGRRFPVCRPEPLADLFRKAGLADVKTRSIDVPMTFRTFDDYWTPFLGGQAPAPGYCMSLSEDRRIALRDHIRANLPIKRDGSIHLIARALAVRGAVY